MTALILALAAFVGTHFAMSHPLRAPFVARMGTSAFQLLYTAVSFATLGAAVVAFRNVAYGELQWEVGEDLWTLSGLIMLAASILFLGSFVRNPALPAPGADKLAAQPARGVFAITRHPMMWSFALWALAHVLVAPRPPVMALTAAIAILALVGAAGQDIKKAKLMGAAWRDWSSRTSYWPFAGQFSGRISWAAATPGMHAIGGGLVVWLLASWAHPLAGSPVVGIWRLFQN